MLRFAFQTRHPITRVAFTADGREVVTAQPFTSVAVRDRLMGEARWTHELDRPAQFFGLKVHPTLGGLLVHKSKGPVLIDPVSGQTRPLWRSGGQGRGHVPEMLGGFQMWWRGSTDGDKVTLTVPLRGSPSVARDRLSARLTTPFRAQHLAIGGVVEFSPNGTRLALGNGEAIRVFDLSPLDAAMKTSGTRSVFHSLLTLDHPDPTEHGTYADKTAEHWLPPVAFDHAGRTMLTLGLRNRVQRIDLATGGIMSEWGWRCEPIRSLAVSPDDLTAAAGCQRGEMVLWDLE